MLEIVKRYQGLPQIKKLSGESENMGSYVTISGITGSAFPSIISALSPTFSRIHLCIAPSREEAAYRYNDFQSLLGEEGVFFFPESYRRPNEFDAADSNNILMRSETLAAVVNNQARLVVSYPAALAEKVMTADRIQKQILRLNLGEAVDPNFVFDVLIEYGFERDDFVYEPGQFSIRGGIIDVFSYSHEYPIRLEFENDRLSSVRFFDPENQLSVQSLEHIEIMPNLEQKNEGEFRISFFDFIPNNSLCWIEDESTLIAEIRNTFIKATALYNQENHHISPSFLFVPPDEFSRRLKNFSVVSLVSHNADIIFHTSPQPLFNKNFNLLYAHFLQNVVDGITTYLFSDQPRQQERIKQIFSDIHSQQTHDDAIYTPVPVSLYQGFIDHDLGVACYTDHQLFDRYKRFQLKTSYSRDRAITLHELTTLQPGDYITHIDHGVGQFAGLEIIVNNGRKQEAVKLIFKDGDSIFVSIHSLHRISRYSSKDSTRPVLNKIGSNTWEKLKAKTKKRVKELAFDLIQLYAKRRTQKGFSFNTDSYLQHELEASFMYEDTPDQFKATTDVKQDMEKPFPMDRLVCGDVGFGKTEVAIRAAFKAVTDGKQVAVLVPTTILALQHFKTFSKRLADFPCQVDYLNRFKTTSEQKDSMANLASGKTDIIIGTHMLASDKVKFKDLGLLVIDEEQKFGVSVKDKLKTIKETVDTLTLTATPIPRTLQFSLLGARDLSIIRTPPPNRYPVQTEIRGFNEAFIRDAIHYEIMRNGQVFFIHNRVQQIAEFTGMIQRICPNVNVRFAHGQMDGKELESIMLDFIEGDFDVLVSTSIVESGLDIPNANTIIINDAHHFGLSDLHQMRGRVGRSNRRAFCYLIAPPQSALTSEARKRLTALVEFSDLGSGFNIAMKDLDIRGAGDLLGADQSGFINEMGYETYQKILTEAVQELKENEFKDLFVEEIESVNHAWAHDCIVETDLELLIPSDYVEPISERLTLYKELDSLNVESEILSFQKRMTDRFGPMPSQVSALMHTIRLRRIARELGFEKIILKNQQLIAYFISNPQSTYYQSGVFHKLLHYLQLPEAVGIAFKQQNNRLSIRMQQIKSIEVALSAFKKMEAAGLTNINA